MNTAYDFIALISAVLALILAGFCAIKLRSLEKLRASFFSSGSSNNLEGIIRRLAENQQQISSELAALTAEASRLERHLGFAAQKIGLIRFNPFADGGGNFSFCVAMLDSHNSGAVLTSLHGREQNRIYAKKIINGQAESPLTDEEQTAIEEAILSHNKKIS